MLFQINSIQYRISNTILVLIISSEFRILWFRDLCIVANVHQNETYDCEICSFVIRSLTHEFTDCGHFLDTCFEHKKFQTFENYFS
jgi:hypothetical protein